jgi:hypothetical protein
MKRFWKFAGIGMLVAILVVTAVGAVALAEEAEEGSDWPFDFGQRFKEALVGILGIKDVATYDAAVEEAREQVAEQALEEGWLTEEQAERMQERLDQAPGARGKGFMGPHRGFMGPRSGFMAHGGNSLVGMIADKIPDKSVQDLFAELAEGKSLAEVASDNGVDAEQVAEEYLAQLGTDLAEAVAEEKITQNQADWMLEQATEQVPNMLNNTWEGRFPGGFRDGGRPGRMWGFPGQSDA